jgi:fumarylpyruvate hydrolase
VAPYSKAFDSSAPCSPLPASVTGHTRTGTISLFVHGVECQRFDLADLIWSVDEIVSFISHSVEFKAGDLIFTGTPSGVGALKPGDVIRASIDGVSGLSLTVVAR